MSLQTLMIPSRDGVNGVKIWAQAVENSSNPAIVFIHGFACSAMIFEKQFTDPEMLESLYMVCRFACNLSNVECVILICDRSDLMSEVTEGVTNRLMRGLTNRSATPKISKLYVQHSMSLNHFW